MGWLGSFRGFFRRKNVVVVKTNKSFFVRQNKRGRPKSSFKKDDIMFFRITKQDKAHFKDSCKRLGVKPSEVLGNFCLTFIASVLKARSTKDLAKIRDSLSELKE